MKATICTERRVVPLLALAALGAGCAPGTIEDPEQRPQPPASSSSELTYSLEAGNLRGKFQRGAMSVDFAALEKDGALYDVTVELNGVVLTSLVTKKEESVDFDGFTSGTGAPTQLRDEDRTHLRALHAAISAEKPIKDSAAGVMLEHGLSLWSQMSDSYPLVKAVHSDKDRSWESLCDWCGTFVHATHDCNQCDFFDDRCSSWALIGTREPSTEYFINGGWIANVTPDHIPLLMERGECYGNCGLGCAAWGEQQLTQDCTDHDQCVRNGHWMASAWCDDDFASASDDEYAAPNCSRYSADTTTVACRATQNWKGWYVIQSCDACPAGYTHSGYTNEGHPTWYPRRRCSKPPRWFCP